MIEKEKEDRYDLLNQHLSGKALLHSDDLSIVLKAHLFLEIFLDEAIYLYYQNERAKDVIEGLNIGFSKKINLIKKYNLLDISTPTIKTRENIKILEEINRLRNRFAHNLACELSSCDDLLGKIFPYFEDAIKRTVANEVHYSVVNSHTRVKFGLCVA
ncbi:MAG: hypothetical protein KC618_06430, partial [Candidatus Omnitrophica bacterium]|nr:hypothetical protein [Candidatus Omnitrophota bacterium]